jgi:hypothetical protein
LFTDIVMSNGMNGIAAHREARRLRPGIRVLLTSGYSRRRMVAERHGLYRQAVSGARACPADDAIKAW